MRPNRIPLFVYAALAATVLLSLFSIWKRYQVETENRAVAISAEYEAIESLSAAQGKPIDAALQDLAAQNLNTVVLSEDTIGGMINEGKAALIATSSPSGASIDRAIRFNDLSEMGRVKRGLSIRFGDLGQNLPVRGDSMVLPPVSSQLIRTTSVGLNPDQCAAVRKAGLRIIARFSNPSGLTAAGVDQTLTWAHEMGATIFLPQGDEVLGHREALDATIESLRKNSMLYASPEFAKISGDTEIVEKAPDIVIRLHAAQTAELDKLSPVDAVDRYVKAARERNMRALLIRPLSFSAPSPLDSFDAFVRDIAKQVIKNGQITNDAPHPYREPGLPKPFFLLLALTIAPAIWYVCARFVSSPRVRTVGAALLGVLVLACWLKLGQEAMALLGSMAFPILGFLVLDEVLPKLKGAELSRICAAFWIVSGVSLVGGLCVAGMLNGLPFYVKAAEFPAVKLSVFLPILVIGIHYFLTLSDWRGALKSPITWGASLLGLVLGLGLALMLARTGNDSGVGPSGGEMVFRNLLDRFLYVRPRTKEFLIGHPILMLGIGMLSRICRKASPAAEAPSGSSAYAGWTILALLVGAIGQTSIVNTLCHLHIPILLSIARDIEGLALGCIIGVVIWVCVGRYLPGREA